MAGKFSLATPGFGDNDENPYDLAFNNEEFQDIISNDDEFENPEVGKRLVSFAFDLNDNYGWDITAVTDPESHEYAIYARRDDRYERVATSFYEFVMEYCLGKTLKTWRPWVAEGGEAMIGTEDYDQEKDRRIFLQPAM